jgi:hypothetical protein
VTARNGVVRLAGTVPSAQAKERALRVARQTPRVSRVEDGLLVQAADGVVPAAAEGASADDAGLAEEVARAIAGRIAGARAGEDWWLTGWRVEGRDNAKPRAA